MISPITRALTGAGAALLAVGLLAGGGGTFAAWSQNAGIAAAPFSAGNLGLAPGALNVKLDHTDFIAGATTINQVTRTTSDITGQMDTYPFAPGDQVTITLPITVQAVGTNLKATLSTTPAALTGTATLVSEVNANNGSVVTLTPVGGAPALTSTGTNQWAITSAHNGAVYLATMKYTVRETSTGAARIEPAGGSGWWNTTLNGTSVSTRNLPFTLTQN